MRDLKSPRSNLREPSMPRRRHWCCSFTTPPLSPDCPPPSRSLSSSSRGKNATEVPSYSPQNQQHQRLPLPWRILSPGRVSPISDQPVILNEMPQYRPHPKPPLPVEPEISAREVNNLGNFDVRLNARGKNGESLVLRLGSKVLAENSPIFADLITNDAKCSSGLRRIEVPEVENLNVFRETIELMFEEDIQKKLQKIGVFRAISILEVSLGIKFNKGVTSCIKYLDAVPWTEEEEEKLRESFSRFRFEDDEVASILDRLRSPDEPESQRTLTKNLISSITFGDDTNARNELKFMVKSLLGKSSVYEKNYPDLKQDIIEACNSCLSSLRDLLEAYGVNRSVPKREKPLLELVSKHIDNINWLFDILLDHHMGEKFVILWANQEELVKMHRNLSPMVRYELSRVTASLLIAMGSRKLHCPSESRLVLLKVWFGAMLCDFSWLQRSKKGLDMKTLEESIGQVVLTLPLNEQYNFFMDWFRNFSKNSSDYPNLSKAFQIWWRRSLLRGCDAFSAESR